MSELTDALLRDMIAGVRVLDKQESALVRAVGTDWVDALGDDGLVDWADESAVRGWLAALWAPGQAQQSLHPLFPGSDARLIGAAVRAVRGIGTTSMKHLADLIAVHLARGHSPTGTSADRRELINRAIAARVYAAEEDSLRRDLVVSALCATSDDG